MTQGAPNPKDPIYVPASEVPMALSLGAVMVEGDGRLFIPSILPEGVTLQAFSRWTTDQARMVWLGEMLEGIVGDTVDIFSIASLLAGSGEDTDSEVVPLYVPSSEMDVARRIPGVWWDRHRRMYVADKSADFGLIHRFLTPAMRAAWMADRNIETAMSALVRARAVIADKDIDEMDPRQMQGERRGEGEA